MPNAAMPAKTREVFTYLKQCALEMRTAEYGEIGAKVRLPAIGVNVPLNYIRDEICIPRGLPWLPALAVNKETRMPSEGWLPVGVAVSVDHLPQFWRGIVLQVYATDWSKIEIENPA